MSYAANCSWTAPVCLPSCHLKRLEVEERIYTDEPGIENRNAPAGAGAQFVRVLENDVSSLGQASPHPPERPAKFESPASQIYGCPCWPWSNWNRSNRSP